MKNKNTLKLSLLMGSFSFLLLQLTSNSHALPLSGLNKIMTSKLGLIFLLVDILLLIACLTFRKNLKVDFPVKKILNTIARNKILLALSLLAIFLPLLIISAHASTAGGSSNAEFDNTVKWLKEHLEGSMGLTVILVDLVMGVFMVIMKKNYMALLGSVVLAILIKFLPDILSSYVGYIL